MTEERWLPIPEAPTYSISDQGKVMDSSGKLVAIDSGRVNIFRLGMRFRINVMRLVRQLFPDVAEAALNEEGEVWKPITGHPGYELSSHARVRRLAKTVKHGQFGANRIISAKVLSPSRNNGYLVVYLAKVGARKGTIFYIEKAFFELFPELAPSPASLPDEEWRDIAGYEGFYQVSNLGRVLSVARSIDDGGGRNRHIRARIRDQNCTSNGYPKAELARDGESKTALVHRLVATAFVPNPLGLDCVHHKDENKLNPRADNLEWVTRAANVRDWFDARPSRINAALIESILADGSAGKSAAEILASLIKPKEKG